MTELFRAAPAAAETVKVALSLRMNPSFSFQSRSGELPRASCCVSHEFKVKYPTQKETEQTGSFRRTPAGHTAGLTSGSA